jgi:putative NADH-flavin reductase
MTILTILIIYALILSAALARNGYRAKPQTAVAATAVAPNRVLIIGATGGTGQQLVAQALERGLTVTAFVRDPSKLSVEHPRLRVVRGDVMDGVSVDAAMRGQDAVLCALGHRQYFRPTRILSEGTHNLLRAMSVHGVRRLVCETTLGIGDSAGRLGLYYTLFVIPFIVPLYFWDKTRQERLIASSDREWVIVRPGALTNGAKRGTVRHGPNVGSFLLTVRISRADVADFMLNQAVSNDYVGAAPGVCW